MTDAADAPTPFLATVVGSLPKPVWLQEKLPLNASGKQVHGCGATWMFEASGIDPALLRLCPSKTVLFGCVDNGALSFDAVETPEHIAGRLLRAAEHLPPEQIQAAPDCGLVPLDIDVARRKLSALARGARLARSRLD